MCDDQIPDELSGPKPGVQDRPTPPHKLSAHDTPQVDHYPCEFVRPIYAASGRLMILRLSNVGLSSRPMQKLSG